MIECLYKMRNSTEQLLSQDFEKKQLAVASLWQWLQHFITIGAHLWELLVFYISSTR